MRKFHLVLSAIIMLISAPITTAQTPKVDPTLKVYMADVRLFGQKVIEAEQFKAKKDAHVSAHEKALEDGKTLKTVAEKKIPLLKAEEAKAKQDKLDRDGDIVKATALFTAASAELSKKVSPENANKYVEAEKGVEKAKNDAKNADAFQKAKATELAEFEAALRQSQIEATNAFVELPQAKIDAKKAADALALAQADSDRVNGRLHGEIRLRDVEALPRVIEKKTVIEKVGPTTAEIEAIVAKKLADQKPAPVVVPKAGLSATEVKALIKAEVDPVKKVGEANSRAIQELQKDVDALKRTGEKLQKAEKKAEEVEKVAQTKAPAPSATPICTTEECVINGYVHVQVPGRPGVWRRK